MRMALHKEVDAVTEEQRLVDLTHALVFLKIALMSEWEGKQLCHT